MTANGGRKLLSSCNLRYDVDMFYDEVRLRELSVLVVQMPGSPPGERDVNKNDGNRHVVTIIIVVSIAACVMILATCAVAYLKKRIKKTVQENQEAVVEMSTVESLQYDFGRIRAVTNGFADANKLGEGGFGTVYRGNLPNGQEIAVKRLSRNSGQGDKEFKNEVVLVAKLQHRNLVRVLGFSMERKERLLIYEFVPNASLNQFIFHPAGRSKLDWPRRYNIIGGIARGLLYLHEDSRLRIIHRDLKPSNILLDGRMNPKIADFGMARLFTQEETQRNATRIVRTFGYMSPEYALYGLFSIKSDVFSFGVLILEIISGTKTTMNWGSSWKLIVMLLAFANLSDFGRGQNKLSRHNCSDTGNYTANSTYHTNLKAALATLSSNTSKYGFYSANVEQSQDRAHAVALCIADVQIHECRTCVENATVDLLKFCSNQMEVIMWYKGGMCTLQYSNKPMTGLPANDQGYGLINTSPVKNFAVFEQVRKELLDTLLPLAANGSPLLKVGAGNKESGFVTVLSALLQCIPTLSSAECNDCLIRASQLSSNASRGTRVLRTSCNIRYYIYSFINQTRLRELNVDYINGNQFATRW